LQQSEVVVEIRVSHRDMDSELMGAGHIPRKVCSTVFCVPAVPHVKCHAKPPKIHNDENDYD